MENKKMKKNVPEELDDNILDHVSGGFVKPVFAEQIWCFCRICRKEFLEKVFETSDPGVCPECIAEKNKNV